MSNPDDDTAVHFAVIFRSALARRAQHLLGASPTQIENVRELAAFIQTLQRISDPQRLERGPIRVDLAARRAYVQDVTVDLTDVEFDLLSALVREPGRPLSRTELLHAAGRADVNVGERTVDVHVCRLRKKLERASRDAGVMIRSIRGSGYQLVTRAAA